MSAKFNGQRLQDLLAANDMSMKRLGAEMYIRGHAERATPEAAVLAWIEGTTQPHVPTTVYGLADIFDKPMTWFFGEGEDDDPA